MKRFFGACAGIFIVVVAFAQKQPENKNPLANGGKGQYEIEHARVEKVFKVTKDGYRFVAYVIDWHSEHVVVSDTLAQSTHLVGDEISFMASRVELPGAPKILSFMLMDLPSTRSSTAK